MSTPQRVGPLAPSLVLSPIAEAREDVELLPRVANAPPWLRKPKDPRWRDEPLETLKFVDNGINIDIINMKLEKLHIQNG